jgi:acyl-CoA synthetase (AMP-forming)/AMP-acid ligase II
MTISIVHGIPLDQEAGIGALTIAGFVREVTVRYKAREALVWHADDTAVRWSYDELWQRSVQIAKTLIACGVGKDTRVGILMTNRPEYLAAVFGTALAGGVIVTLNTFSTPPELEHLLQLSAVSMLLFERHVAAKDFAAMLTTLEPQIKTASAGQLLSPKFPFLRHIVMLDSTQDENSSACIENWNRFIDRGVHVPLAIMEARAASTKPADVGVLFFSSGTTGLPKGIVHSQRAVALQWWRWRQLFQFRDAVRCWTANGFFWSGQFSMMIGTALSSGGCLVLQSTFSAPEALELMQAERVEMPMASAHQWARIEAAPNFQRVDLSSLYYIDDRAPAGKQPTITTTWRLPLAYGTTETLALSTAVPLTTPRISRRGYGFPLPGNTLKVVDPLTGAVMPRGARGEIAIKGPTLMMGYMSKNYEETFDAEGFYRTGDGGYIEEDGWLVWEGRLSDIIKTGGANVSPVEIDAVIRTYPGVKVTQTVGVPHDTLGEIVVACIVPHDGAVVDENALREFLKEKLASYKIPRRMLFLREEELSITGSSKVKAGALRELAAKKLAIDAAA